MTGLYKHLLRPLLFSMDSEEIHNRTVSALGVCARQPLISEAVRSFLGAPPLPVELFGLRFPNPIGLAAGMDKHAAALPAWVALGFGFCELGGVTLHAQPGNPAPRMFRVVADEALINRMGFNNPGAEVLAQTLARWRASGRWPSHPVGINLGKSKITPLDGAAQDYVGSFKLLRDSADFFVVNVSSPNTPNLRQLQDKSALDEILAALQEANQSAADANPAPPNETPAPLRPASSSSDLLSHARSKPILIKIAPDLSFTAIDEILSLAEPRQLAGVVATNTTLARPETTDEAAVRNYSEAGGLSGRPLRQRATECIRHVYRQTKGRLPVIGVGGIFDARDAWEKITAGATLLQVYSGLVYEGPGIARAIVTGLRDRLTVTGFRSLEEAVGSEAIN